MTADDSKFYLGYLNKLVDEYNHTYHCSIDKKPIHADFSALTEEIESSHKTLEFKVSDRVRVTKHENIFSKSYTKNQAKEIFVTNPVLETNPSGFSI